jgi:hypothetical protein
VTGGDIEEDEFVGPFLLVAFCYLHGVARVAEVDEIGSFDDPPFADVEAGDDAGGQHGGRDLRR